jgi:hypothetical protein
MRDIIAGLVLIGIGLALGGSIFRGDFSLTSLFFDGLGLFWLGKGAYGIYKARSE